MTNDNATPGADEAIITLEGEDGTSYNCQILDIIEFEGQEYGILLKLKGQGDESHDNEEEESLVIMRLIQRDDQSIFRTIESDDEFDKVVAYVEELARAAAGADD
ncbi:MAG: DUF1292 domain-containing protein [Candidatus Obscuribacterales bacterium]|nr:DUF1292 domain-containing protein [Candidatus Obscuribacterales bacterium]